MTREEAAAHVAQALALLRKVRHATHATSLMNDKRSDFFARYRSTDAVRLTEQLHDTLALLPAGSTAKAESVPV